MDKPQAIPVIDIGNIDQLEEQQKIAEQITDACKTWGFFLVKNHPIPINHVNEMFGLGKKYFLLPEEEKEPYKINRRNVGYIGSFKDRNKDDKMSMWFGGVPGALDPKGENAASIPPYWHEHTDNVQSFKHECYMLANKLLMCFALAMKLPNPEFFSSGHKEDGAPGAALRMILYPARDSPTEANRMGAHTDSGSVTLLFQDCAGLEVMSPANEWVRAPAYENHILINLGDCLQFWSGNQLKSTLHRVTQDGVPYDRARQTMAYFLSANEETMLEPVVPIVKGKLVNGQRGTELPSKFTAGEYNRQTMMDIYGPIMST